MTRRTLYYRLHSIKLKVTCDPAVAAALYSRLGHFATGNLDVPDLTFDFSFVPDAAHHTIVRPVAPIRPVYDPPLGEVVYVDATDQLYMNYGDRVRVRCDLGDAAVWVSALESEQSDLWLLTHPLFTLALTECLKRRALYPLHAAALAGHDKCVLLAGTTGAGKSTLTLALLKAGFDFLSDDLAFLRPSPAGLQILAFPEEIDVTDETVRLFPELAGLLDQPQLPSRRKRQVSAERFSGREIILECQPSVLVFPHVANADKSVLTPVPAEEAFLELLPNVLLTEAHSSQAHLDVLAELAKHSSCYRLETGRDLETLPLLLRQLVER